MIFKGFDSNELSSRRVTAFNMRDFFSALIKQKCFIIFPFSFTCINTENCYFSLFFPIFSLKNKEKYQFSIYLQLKLIKIIIKHFLFIIIEKKSRIEQAVTRLENNSLLPKPIPWNKDKMPGYRFWQQGIILKTSYSLQYARFFLYINEKKMFNNNFNQF